MRNLIVFIALLFLMIFPTQTMAKLSCQTLATDIEIVYLYDEAAYIDWPLIYYLAAEKDCRVNLITLKSGNDNQCEIETSEEYNIVLYQFMAKDTPGFDFDKIVAGINSWRSPDVVIFGRDLHRSVSAEFESYLLAQNYDAGNVFNIQKVLRGVESGEGGVYINNNLYLVNHYDRINRLAAEFSSSLEGRS